VEKSAAAAIFRMVEEEKNIAEMYDAITVSLFFLIQNKAKPNIN
jgi:hypothetical protein